MYIHKLELENLRSFAKAEVDFSVPGDEPMSNVTLLLGDNGAGKTTALRGVTLAALGRVLRQAGFVPFRLARRNSGAVGRNALRGSTHAYISLSEREAEVASRLAIDPDGLNRGYFLIHIDVSPTSGSEELVAEAFLNGGRVKTLLAAEREVLNSIDAAGPSAFFLLAYGATRRVESAANVDSSARAKARGYRYQRVAGLFEEAVTLMPLSFWFPIFQTKNPGRAKQTVTLINKLLPKDCKFLPEVVETESGYEYLFNIHGQKVPFAALSDGYRAYIGWIADMLYHLNQGAGSGKRLDETEGIILIDEVDLHLHPSWQREVLPTLSKALPKMQFIVTTHSPLVTSSIPHTQVRVLKASKKGTTIHQLEESLEGKTADQVLRSPYFGLDSTRSARAEQRLNTLANKATKGDADAALDYMKAMAGVA